MSHIIIKSILVGRLNWIFSRLIGFTATVALQRIPNRARILRPTKYWSDQKKNRQHFDAEKKNDRPDIRFHFAILPSIRLS